VDHVALAGVHQTLGAVQPGVEAALEQTITEALMVNVHTEYVRDFEFTWSADEIRITFTVKGRSWDEVKLSTSILT